MVTVISDGKIYDETLVHQHTLLLLIIWSYCLHDCLSRGTELCRAPGRSEQLSTL